MDKYKEITYTETAKAMLTEAKEEYARMLEQVIKEKKYVIGDDLLEITASDVENAKRQLRPISRKAIEMRTLLSTIYILFGVIGIFWGLFYGEILEIVKGNPMRLPFLLGGIVLVVIGVVFRFFSSHFSRERIYQERLQTKKDIRKAELEARISALSDLTKSVQEANIVRDVSEIEKAIQHLERVVIEHKKANNGTDHTR